MLNYSILFIKFIDIRSSRTGPPHYIFLQTFSRQSSRLSQSICFPEIDRRFAFVNSEKSVCFNMFITSFLIIFILAAELSFRNWDKSSPKTTSSSQCKPFSTPPPNESALLRRLYQHLLMM